MTMVLSRRPNQQQHQPNWTISITDRAAQRILELREQENQTTLMLRLTVAGGGCAGFQYDFSLETSDNTCQDDVVFEHQGARIVIDECSLRFVTGIEIDFVEDLTSASFHVHNPNAVSSCGCGASFSI